jgi:hypothetical protein
LEKREWDADEGKNKRQGASEKMGPMGRERETEKGD